MLEATAERTGIRIIYLTPGGHKEVFGAENSSALLKGKLVEPKAGLKPAKPSAAEQPALTEGSGKGSPKGSTRPRGGTSMGTAGRVGNGLGVLGFAADIYFLIRYGPFAVNPMPDLFCVSVPYA
jgi:hypothetical protein